MTVDEIAELHMLVLAAGDSRRFGSPKQLLAVDGETLLHRVSRQAQSVCPRVTVVLGARAPAMTQAIEDLPVMRISNPDWQSGMASSLRAGVLSLPATADAIMILLCDQPAVTAEHMQLLMETWQRQPVAIVAGAYNGIRGVPVVFPRDYFSQLVTLSGDKGARELLDAPDAMVIPVDLPAAAYDIDTPADIERLQENANIQISKPAAETLSQ